ncbi:MAG TPA: hypothetical protein VKB79_16840 [Bryobacteraceae bacterium]|nr:hypothetical protein [Bryobacteraceae bacterium]
MTPLAGQTTVTGYGGVTASVSANGAWSVFAPAQNWTFSGTVGANTQFTHADSGSDNLGTYQEIAFAYSIRGTHRAAAIRLYPNRPVVLFFSLYNDASANAAPFPLISAYPSLPHLSFNGEFAVPDFKNLHPDSPWAFFDSAYNTWILSPAANYMTAQMAMDSSGNITGGIADGITSLPAGFTHATALTIGVGVNATFDAWGQAITDLTQKQKPANDADTLLKNVSYWTDNGATYYYNPGAAGYMGTLDAVRANFDAIGIRLGSLQLDSWWYPKGPDNSWSSHMGIWTYTAAPSLFQPSLAGFQAGLKVPLITHARWIDGNSPYRTQYVISGNVATDPQYWEDIGSYLQAADVKVYEQDWLGEGAQTSLNLTDPYLFLGNMAASMAKRGINIQYCMATPKHFLQSTNYPNVTTIRTSNDRFGSNRWTEYFYSNRFASSVGLWPFSDVFMSSETENAIAALLSGGPLGVGDAVGALSGTNLARAARADGVIVKPDTTATPIDSVFAADGSGIDTPMIASAATDFGSGLRASYIFAYARGANNTVVIDPAAFGIAGPSFLYDNLAGTGVYLNRGQTYTFQLTSSAGYYALVPVGPTGIAFLGDHNQFVTLGRQRVSSVSDDGTLNVTVAFAPGERVRTIFGYSPQAVSVKSISGANRDVEWDPSTGIFTALLMPYKGSAQVRIGFAAAGEVSTGCSTNCAK